MAEERIDIEVTDKVAKSIPDKLRDIADQADRGFTYVQRLKGALSSINADPMSKLAAASAQASNALARELNAQSRLTAAQSASAVATAKAATEQQRLATETARTEAAQARAAAAISNAESAALRLQVAQSKLASTAAQAATATSNEATDMAKLKAQFEAGEISIRKYVAALQQANAAANASGAAGAKVAGGLNQAAAANDKYAASAGKTRSQNANIIAQLQDIGVSLAGGQNPLLVMVQQGSQLSYIASTMDGGFKALTATILRLLAPFTLLAAVVGGLYLGFRNFTNDIAAKHKPELENYANSLGLTSKEMDKLGNTTVGANGKLKEFDTVTITMADSWNGFVATVKEGLAGLVEPFSGVTSYFKTAWDAVMKFLYYAFLGFYGAVVGGMKAIVRIIADLPNVAANTAKSIANVTLAAIEFMVNKTIDGINAVVAWAQPFLSKFGIEVGSIGQVAFGRFEKTGANAADVIAGAFNESVVEADRTLTAFSKRWEQNSVDAARKRIKAAADAIKDNRTDPKAKKDKQDPKSQVDFIKETTNALDNEISRMKQLKDEREVQQRLDQIEQQFLQRRMPLDQAQLSVFRQKIQAIQDYKYVQAEMDRIVEEAQGPQRTYNAVVQASTDLLARHVITQEQFNEQIAKAGRNLAQATDPLFAMKESLDAATRTTGLYGDELERANYLEQIRQQYAAQGKTIYDASTGALKAEVAQLVAKNNALMQQQYIRSQLGAVLNPILDQNKEVLAKQQVYDQLEALRQKDLINEDTYQQALAALYVKYNEQRLQSSSDFFGALADVTKNGTGVVGAISKAAAVAQATIDGYLAVQKALASAPPPFNYVAAAAVAIKTGANVAGILSTSAGGFANGGSFMVGGKGGIDQNNINMDLTRGERVTIETAKQQRANDNATGSPVVNANTKVVNLFDEREFIGAMDSDEGERVVMNIIRRNATGVRSTINGG